MKIPTVVCGLIGLLLSIDCFAQVQPETISFSSAEYTLVEVPGMKSPVTVVRTGGTGAALDAVVRAPELGELFAAPVHFTQGAATAQAMIPFCRAPVTLTLYPPDGSIAVSPFSTARINWHTTDLVGQEGVFLGLVLNGTLLVAVNATGSFTAQLNTLNGREIARGVFGATQRAYVVFRKARLEIDFQRYLDGDQRYLDGDTVLEGAAVVTLVGPVPATFVRVLRRSELNSLPAQRVFTGAFRWIKGGLNLAAPTNFRLSSGGRWTIFGYDLDGRAFSTSSPALAGNRVCFAYIQPKGHVRVRTGMLTYDPVNKRLSGSIAMGDQYGPDYGYSEEGTIGSYVRPVLGSLPGVFAGSLPTPARFIVTDQSGSQSAQAFSWTSPSRVVLEGGVNVRFNQTLNLSTGLMRGRFKAAGMSKVANFAAALVNGTGTADDGTFMGSGKADNQHQMIQIVGP